MISSKPFTFDRVVRLIIGLAVMTLIILLIRRLSAVLLPFFTAWLLAYFLHPVVTVFQYKLRIKNRPLSIFAALCSIFIVIAGFIWWLSPLVSAEIIRMSELVNLYLQQVDFQTYLPQQWQTTINHFLINFDLKQLFQDPNFEHLINKFAPQLWVFVDDSLNVILGFTVIVVVFLYTVFILFDYEKITKDWIVIIPVRFRPLVEELASDIEEGMNRYFRGQALIALIVGLLLSIGFSIIGLPLGILFGLILGLLTLVPYLKIIGLVPGVYLVMMKSIESGNSFYAELWPVVLIFAIVQLFEDMYLTPKIMGKVTGMKPAVILLSLSIWGSLMGVIGVIIALPLTTLILSYYKRFIVKESLVDKLLDIPEHDTPDYEI